MADFTIDFPDLDPIRLESFQNSSATELDIVIGRDDQHVPTLFKWSTDGRQLPEVTIEGGGHTIRLIDVHIASANAIECGGSPQYSFGLQAREIRPTT